MNKKTPGKRGDIFRFLAALFLRPPDETLSDFNESHLQELRAVFKNNPGMKYLEEFLAEKSDFKQEREDYENLFLIPASRYVHPYESVYLEKNGLLWGETTLQVKNLYERVGFLHEEYEVPDHIGVELLFMSSLCDEEDKLSETDPVGARKAHELQLEFLKKHLSIWVDKLADNIIKKSATPLYRGVAEMTKKCIKQNEIE
ncbi:MAG: hypothetical protein FIB08_01250 [Candidatus Methanoperedens sp.]|nr:hypothetical protein [Candidatus Methanoperedens sp.]